jgi:hypothetical protein
MSKPLSERGRAAVARLRKAQVRALRSGLETSKAIAQSMATGSAPAGESARRKPSKHPSPAKQPELRPAH